MANYLIPEQLLNALITYLSQRQYSEVYMAIHALQSLEKEEKDKQENVQTK